MNCRSICTNPTQTNLRTEKIVFSEQKKHCQTVVDCGMKNESIFFTVVSVAGVKISFDLACSSYL